MSTHEELLDEEVRANGSLNKGETDSFSNYNDQKQTKTYTLYPLRWAICIFFTTSVVASGLGMVAFSPISQVIKATYNVSDLTVTMLVLPFTIMFIPCIFPANYLIDNKGIRINVYIASI